MKKYSVAFLFFCIICFKGYTQKIDGMDLNTIKMMVNDEKGVYYYPKLVKTFEEAPQTLRKIDMQMLYYGFAFTKNYNPYRHFELEDSLHALTKREKGVEAIVLANQLLEENPVSVTGNVEKAFALNGLNQKRESAKFLQKYKMLMDIIMASGQGSSYENPIVLITPKDAEVVLLRHNLISVSKTLNGRDERYYDVYVVKNKEEKEYPIYFDITIPYTLGMKKIQEENE